MNDVAAAVPDTAPETAPESGLSAEEAARRLAVDGPNLLPGGGRRSLLTIALETLREPMFLLLLAAGTLYLVFGGWRWAGAVRGGEAVPRAHRGIAGLSRLAKRRHVMCRHTWPDATGSPGCRARLSGIETKAVKITGARASATAPR